MHHLKPLVAFVGVASLALAGTALGSTPHATAPLTIVSSKQTSLGTILVTRAGQTLYLDTSDKPPHFACTGACLKAWPPLKVIGVVKATGAAKAALLGATKGPGGKTVTYNGHPLYTFIADTKNAPTSGEGQHGFYVVSPTGNKIAKPKTSTQKKKPPSKPPGY